MISKLLFAISKVACLSLGGRALDVYKERVLGCLLGSTDQTDIFTFVERIRRMLYSVLVEGVVRQAVLPVLMGYHGEKRKQARLELEHSILAISAICFALLTLLMMILCPALVACFGFGWFLEFFRNTDKAYKFSESVKLLRITLPAFFCLTFIGALGAFLHVRKAYLAATSIPLLLNLGLILSAILWAPYTSDRIFTLALGLLLTGAIVLIVQLALAYHHGVQIWPITYNLRLPGLKRILQLLPTVFTNGCIAQTRSLCLIVIGSFFPSGALSCLNYTYQLSDLPTGALSMGLGTIFLPWLAKRYQKFRRQNDLEQLQHFQLLLQTALRIGILLSIPVLIYMLSTPGSLLTIFFGRIYLESPHQHLFIWSLQLYNFGNFLQTLATILLMGLYAQQKVKMTAKITLIAACLEIGLSLLAMLHQPIWLAWSYTIAALGRVILLVYALKEQLTATENQISTFDLSARCIGASLLVYLLRIVLSRYAMASAPSICHLLLGGGLFVFYPLFLKLLGVKQKDLVAYVATPRHFPKVLPP